MTESSDMVDPALPPLEVLALLGAVNIAWSLLDARVTAALYSLLNVDEIELTLLLGKLDSQDKIEKIEKLLAHRGKSIQYVASLKKALKRLRPDRNALTHGVYQGKTAEGTSDNKIIAPKMVNSSMSYSDDVRLSRRGSFSMLKISIPCCASHVK